MQKRFVLLLTSRGLASVLQAVLFSLLARAVTVHSFGTFTAMSGVVGFVLVFTGAGMPGIIARAQARGERERVSDAVTVTWASGALSAVLISAAIAIWSPGDTMALIIVSWSLIVERTTDAMLNAPIADGLVMRSAWPLVARRALSIALLLAGLSLQLNAMLTYAGAALIGASAGQLLARTLTPVPRGSLARTRELVREGSAFMWNTLAAQSRMLDTTITAVVLGPATSAVYSAASKLVQPTLLVPQAIASLMLPHAARTSRARARAMQRPLLLVGLASLVAMIPFALLAEPILVFMLGHRYAAAASTLRWLLLGMPFAAVAAPQTAILQGQGKERLAAVNGIVFGILLLASVAVGAGVGGPDGAALGLSLSFVVRSITLALSVRSLVGGPDDDDPPASPQAA